MINLYGDISAGNISENGSDVVSRIELPPILAEYTIAAPTLTVSTNYSIQNNDNTILVNGAYTVTLPSASSVPNKVYNVKRISDAGPVTIAVTGNNTIDGASSVNLTTRYASLAVISDGSNWWVF